MLPKRGRCFAAWSRRWPRSQPPRAWTWGRTPWTATCDLPSNWSLTVALPWTTTRRTGGEWSWRPSTAPWSACPGSTRSRRRRRRPSTRCSSPGPFATRKPQTEPEGRIEANAQSGNGYRHGASSGAGARGAARLLGAAPGHLAGHRAKPVRGVFRRRDGGRHQGGHEDARSDHLGQGALRLVHAWHGDLDGPREQLLCAGKLRFGDREAHGRGRQPHPHRVGTDPHLLRGTGDRSPHQDDEREALTAQLRVAGINPSSSRVRVGTTWQ